MERIRMSQTRKYELALMKYLRQQEQQIKWALTGHKAEGNIWDMVGMTQEEYNRLTEAEKARAIEQLTDGLIDWKNETGVLEMILAPLWEETYKEGAESLKKTYRLKGVDIPELTHIARVQGGQRVTRVTQTAKDAVSRIITAGLEEGKGNGQLADEIMKEIGVTSKRARLIAEQECGTSLMAGNYDMAKKGGFRAKTWHTLNGRTVPFDAPFVTMKGNRLMMPRDPECDAADEVIRCRCYLTYS